MAKPAQDMRFDVPVIGPKTIAVMRAAGATCLAIEAGRTLIFDRDTVQELAAAAGIAIIAVDRLRKTRCIEQFLQFGLNRSQ